MLTKKHVGVGNGIRSQAASHSISRWAIIPRFDERARATAGFQRKRWGGKASRRFERQLSSWDFLLKTTAREKRGPTQHREVGFQIQKSARADSARAREKGEEWEGLREGAQIYSRKSKAVIRVALAKATTLNRGEGEGNERKRGIGLP